MRSLRLVLSCALVGCSIFGSYYVTVERTDEVPLAVGDTASFVATEWLYTNSTDAADPSTTSTLTPGRFTWTTSDSTVAALVSPGRFLIKAGGQARISATTKHGSGFRDVVIK
jgi:hypothetical protein